MNKSKAKELTLYIVFGVLTTAINFVAFWLIQKTGINYLVNNAISWVIAVAFAYVTNKLFVFESKSWNAKLILRELSEFVLARLFSFGIEEGGLWLLVDILGMNKISTSIFNFDLNGEIIAKVILAIIVVILNYIFSKLIIFKKDEKKD